MTDESRRVAATAQIYEYGEETYMRWGRGAHAGSKRTVTLVNIKTAEGELLSERSQFTAGKGFASLQAVTGDLIQMKVTIEGEKLSRPGKLEVTASHPDSFPEVSDREFGREGETEIDPFVF